MRNQTTPHRDPQLSGRSAIPLLFVGCALLAACGSGGESATEDRTPEPASVLFDTRTDTITTLYPTEQTIMEWGETLPEIRYMVQVGAFRDPANARIVQESARERFHIPVVNDYHAPSQLYQVRIGFFEDFESARRFLYRVQSEFPGDYNDAWVVQLRN